MRALQSTLILNESMNAKLDTNNPADINTTTDTPFKIRVPIAIKLALAITLLIVTGMATLGFIILENQKSVLSEQIRDMGTAITHQFANSASEMILSDDGLSLETLVINLVDKQQVIGTLVLSDKQQPLASHGTIPPISYIFDAINHKQEADSFEWNSGELDDQQHICFYSPIIFKQLVVGQVLVTFSKQHMLQSLQQSRYVILMMTALMTLIAMLIAFVMSRHLSKPIHNLVDASKAIGLGNYQYRLSERRNDEIGELSCAFNQMAHGLLKKIQVENAFSRYVSSNVARKILENLDEVQLGGKHVSASVLFADIVGFTSISERLPPEEIANLLNEYFSLISRIAQIHNGHIDKFMGDCAMVVFGVPDFSSDHSFNAVSCAVMIQQAVVELNEQRQARGKIPIHFKIGVNTGTMIAGNLGSDDRMEYTVIGDPVNLASRLAGIATSDQIIVLEEFYMQPSIKQRVIANKHEIIRVRGKKDAVSTWIINDLESVYHDNMQLQIQKLMQLTRTGNAIETLANYSSGSQA